MNSNLLKESELEINAYLNSLSLHQSFEEDEIEEEEFLNPSGSVLQPASNPYNKQKKIAEANESLFAEDVPSRSPQKVKFNKVEKRICYDYFGSSFESDSIKSYEEEESEKESLLQTNGKVKTEQNLELKGNHLQLKNPASKVVVTVSEKSGDEQKNSESESEDVCVGTVNKDIKSAKIYLDTEKNSQAQDISVLHVNTNVPEKDSSNHVVYEDKESNKDKRKEDIEQRRQGQETKTENEKKEKCVEDSNVINSKNVGLDREDSSEICVPGNLDVQREKCSNNANHNSDFYPCLGNHSGITIRITGADSIESVESESTDELQLIEDFNTYNMFEFNQDRAFPMPKRMQSAKPQSSTMKIQHQTFVLKGTKTNPNIRSPRQNKKCENMTHQQLCSKKGRSEKELYHIKQNQTTIKSEKPKDKILAKSKTNSKTESLKSKDVENKSNLVTEECVSCTKKARPKSCVESGSVRVKPSVRPVTAPVKRSCCQWGAGAGAMAGGVPHLPDYNGLRSEYGLSAEQLLERKRHKMEIQKIQKQKKEQKHMEEIQKRKENEATFIAWLENKRKQAQMQFLRNQKLQAESGIKIYPAPTAHLKRTGAVRSRKLFKSQRKCVSLEELLSNAGTHDQNTYRIYLGLSFE